MNRLFAVMVSTIAVSAAGEIVSVGSVPVKSDFQSYQETMRPHEVVCQTCDLGPSERYIRDQVIVRFKPWMNEADVKLFCKEQGVEILRKGRFIDYYRLQISSDACIEEVVRRFSSRIEVEFAEPNYILRALWTPNDPYYWNYQWNLRRTGALDMQLAWELSKGSGSVTVAVVDEGVAYEDYPIPSHEIGEVYSPDGQYHRAPDLGYNLFVQGYDFVNDDAHPNDEGGHGTHVAGTIAQSTHNNLGCAGMAPNCKIMPVRVLGLQGGTNDDIAEGISYAWQHGAKVINLSLGGPNPAQLLHDAIIDATNAGVVVVAASGNDSLRQVSYPAAYPECIAVGAVDGMWAKAYYSNWGPELDVVAPGGDVRSHNYWPIYQQTYNEAGGTPPINVSTFDYKGFQGTSMAAPHVSALVAMMMARGIRNPSEIKNRLYRSAIDLGPSGWDEAYGWGLIEPVGALGGLASWLWYDNSDPDNYWYVNNGSQRRFAVYFTPDMEAPFDITEGHVLVWDDGGRYNFKLTINPVSGGHPDLSRNLAGPVTFATVGDQSYAHWYKWDFALRRTSRSGYFMVFHWVPPYFGPPYVGGDTTSIDSRSYYYASSGWNRTLDQDWYLRTILLKDTLTIGIKEEKHPVAEVYPSGIVQVIPQPAAGPARVIYSISRRAPIRLSILSASGQVVRKLFSGPIRSGRHQTIWDCRDDKGALVPSGVYFVRLDIECESYASRVVMLREVRHLSP